MMIHPTIPVLFVIEDRSPSLNSLVSYLASTQHVRPTIEAQLPGNLEPYDVVVTADTARFADACDRLQGFVAAGGGWLGLTRSQQESLPQLFGAQPGPVKPAVELRVLFQDHQHPMARRLPEAVYLPGQYQALEQNAGGTEVVLYADWHYGHGPVLVERQVEDGRVACTTLQAFDTPALQRDRCTGCCAI